MKKKLWWHGSAGYHPVGFCRERGVQLNTLYIVIERMEECHQE